jgi:tetratricopeptide (TPR) repeat protein
MAPTRIFSRVIVIAVLVLFSGASLVWGESKEEQKDHEVAEELLNKGEYDKAVLLRRKILEIAEKSAEKDPAALADALYELSGDLMYAGQAAEAETHARRGLAIIERIEGADSAKAATLLEALYYSLLNQKRYAELEELAKRAVSIREKDTDAKKLTTAIVHLGTAYAIQEKFSEADSEFTKALKLIEKIDTPSDTLFRELAEGLIELGFHYLDENKLDEAEKKVTLSLKILPRLTEPDDYRLSIGKERLAQVRRRQSRYKEAAVLLEDALTHTQKLPGDQSQGIFLIQFSLSMTYWEDGDKANAQRILESLAKTSKQFLKERPEGDAHRFYSSLNLRLASLYIEKFQKKSKRLPSKLDELTTCSESLKTCVPFAPKEYLSDYFGTIFKYSLENNGNSYRLSTLGKDWKEGGEGADTDFFGTGP